MNFVYFTDCELFLILACPKLTNPANGIAGNYSDNKAPVGATSTFSCHGKYILSGAANVTCQANGNWTTAPKCELCKKCLIILLLAVVHVVSLWLDFSLPYTGGS